jgi:endoglucanase
LGNFYPAYAGTLYDWNQLYPRIVQAIREVDPDTPILVSAMGWGSVRWLPFLEPVDDPRTVYMVHQYEPQEQYTHQPYPVINTYPGSFDLNWDGAPDVFDRAWLDGYLSIIDDFKARSGAPVAVNEFGVMRWSPGAADFMRDSMDLFEQRGMNHAFWAWNPLWPPYSHIDDMNYLRGPDPDDHTDLATSDLIDVITQTWGRNAIQPSNAAD